MRDAIKTLGAAIRSASIRSPRPNWSSITPSRWMSTGTPGAYAANSLLEFQRNRERYAFLKWGQSAFRPTSPPYRPAWASATRSISNISRAVFTVEINGELRRPGPRRQVFVAGVDRLPRHPRRHRLAHHHDQRPWRAGLGRRRHRGRASMLGQPISYARSASRRPTTSSPANCAKVPRPPISFLTVTQALRKLGVVGKFVEFYGPGIAGLPLADRATIGNMAPCGATCGIFPVDATAATCASPAAAKSRSRSVEAYYKEQGLFHTAQLTRGRVHPDPRTRSRRRRAQRGRAQAPAGPRAAQGAEPACAATPPARHGQAARLAHGRSVAAQNRHRHRRARTRRCT